MSRNVIVIGGVALGPKAASRLKRLDPTANVTMIDENINISFGGCGIPYYVSGEINSLDALRSTTYGTVRTPEYFEHKGVHTLNQTRVTAIDRAAKTVTAKNLVTGEEKALPYDRLIIATGSTPDIFMNYWNNAPAWSDKGALYDLTDFVNNDADWNKADFVDATWGLCTYNDHIYSIPYSMSTTFMVYRPDLLAEAGWDHFPANTEELLQCAMDCTKLDDAGNIVQMGLVPDYYWLDTILWPAAFGGTWMDGDTPDFTNKQQLEAYKFQSAILNKYGYDNVRRFVDSFGTPGTPEDALFKGKVAMRWLPDSALADMEEYGKDVEWAMAPMPYPEGVQGGQMLTCGVWEMNAHTENPEATWKVMASLTGEENMKFLAEGDHNHGTFMPRKSALNHVINDLDVSENTKKNATVLLNDNLTHFPMVSYIGEYLNIISTEMNEALMGNISVEDAAQKVQDQVSQLVG